MVEFKGKVKQEVKIAARVLDSYTRANVVVSPGKNQLKRGQDNWLISTSEESFLIEAFRKIHRNKYGSVRFFNSRLENFERDRQSLLAYSF